MKKGYWMIIATVIVASASLALIGQNTESPGKRLALREIQWPASRGSLVGTAEVSGLQTIMLKGDPSKPGLYTVRIRIAPNTKIQAHAHRDDRVGTVISGTWYFGYGDRFNEAALKALPPGSLYTEPPSVNHFAMTKEEVIVQVTGVGPSDTTYVDPRNDPTRQ